MEEDGEVFEITDFTTASDWERFVSKLEEVLHEWNLIHAPSFYPPLTKDILAKGSWRESIQSIQFADFHFFVKHHELLFDSPEQDDNASLKSLARKIEGKKRQSSPTPSSGEDDCDHDGSCHFPVALEDMMVMESDFPARCHCLARWHGLREFVVIQPASASDAILQDSKANVLLSSVSMAVNNANCRIPVFVQTQEWRKKFYVGWCEGPGARVNFEMVHLQKAPYQYSHLSGLLEVFKEKITQHSCEITVPPVTISVRMTYSLDLESFCAQGFWPQAMPDVSLGGEDSVGIQDFSVLPFGPIEDPVRNMIIATTWPCLSEHLVTETDSYSDLNPLQAPIWTARAVMAENVSGLLGECLKLFIDACCNLASTEHLLSPKIVSSPSSEGNKDIAEALQRVTPGSPIEAAMSRVSRAVTDQASRLAARDFDNAPLSENLLNRVLWYIFPDARPDDYRPNRGEEAPDSYRWSKVKEFESLVKASPPFSSLSHRLSLAFAAVNYGFKGGLPGIAFLWQEFVMELRFRWENSVLIPLLQRGIPDTATCLLHQKLQLLNCCIERKRARERMQNPLTALTPATGTVKVTEREKSGESDSDDDFYECSESLDDYSFISRTPSLNPIENLPEEEGEGRLRLCGVLKLLERPEKSIYVPITQDPSPMTEDMLHEHAEVLTRLGSGPEGAHLRAQMQSASLLSDMEAFKAANPGCILADFVRWYSPRDFIEDDRQPAEETIPPASGHLSSRMSIEGNIWLETWAQARPCPAKRQRRLFDDTREAEKVLHFLANLKPGEACRMMLPCLLQAAVIDVHELAANVKGDVPTLDTLLDSIYSRAVRATRGSSDIGGGSSKEDDLALAEEVVALIARAESTIARAQSLQFKLDTYGGDPECKKEVDRFVFQLLENTEVNVFGAGRGHVGSSLQRLLENQMEARQESDVVSEVNPTTKRDAKIRPSLFPTASAKEYIFRVKVPRPALFSKQLPQRMFAVVATNEFRIAGAFTEDTVFF